METYNDKFVSSDKIELIQVSGDRNIKKATAWAKKESLPWPTVLRTDIPNSIIKNIKFSGYPTYVLIDKDGKEIKRSHSSSPVIKKLDELTE